MLFLEEVSGIVLRLALCYHAVIGNWFALAFAMILAVLQIRSFDSQYDYSLDLSIDQGYIIYMYIYF